MSVREAGMNVEFNGKYYTLLSESKVQRYEIGEMISELCRLDPKELKKIILLCSGFREDLDPE